MNNYKSLSTEISNQIASDRACGKVNPYAFSDESAIRRKDNSHDSATIWRSNFIRDVDKIMHCPFFNRYTDKTQVFSLYKNDDISRRSLHVQLVSRTARTIGKVLNLNLELIEAIALGHDIGHTPFGHTGERFLDQLFVEYAGKRFFHNLQSVRVLDEIFPLNVSLQTLDGIASHNGELELKKYSPSTLNSFDEFDKLIHGCYENGENVLKLTPCTLEGCVVRISDIIAYLGKDRQDAEKRRLDLSSFSDDGIGISNSEIINNLIVNIIENSYNMPFIKMDDDVFSALIKAKKSNYEVIYNNPKNTQADETIKLMMSRLYQRLLNDLNNGKSSSPIFTQHLTYIDKPYYKRSSPYLDNEKNQIVVDFIASMTDDYFIELYKYLFPKSSLNLSYVGYFD